MSGPGDKDKHQVDKFRDVARQLECDEDEKAFEEKVRRVAQATVEGTWEVLPLKDGSGFYPHFTPKGYGPTHNGPDFPTEAEAQAWIDARR